MRYTYRINKNIVNEHKIRQSEFYRDNRPIKERGVRKSAFKFLQFLALISTFILLFNNTYVRLIHYSILYRTSNHKNI